MRESIQETRAEALSDSEVQRREQRFRLFYDETPTMFFTVDASGIVHDLNRFAVEHLGYGEDELLGQDVLKIVHPSDHAEVTRHLETSFAEPGSVRQISFRKICKDGRMIWVKETSRVVQAPEGARAFIVCEDVSDARAHEEAARRAENKAHERDEFMAMLGHELRNPLAPIVTALELLRRKGRDDHELEIIGRQIAHLRRLVDDLLDISRITRGKVELHKEHVDLAVVAAQAAEVAKPLFRRKRQSVNVLLPDDALVLDADPARLVQVLSNVLTNAAKYSGPDTAITLEAKRRGERVRVIVRDEGEGIAPDMLERIFDLFVQREQSTDRAQSGLGLGLTIVRNLVELHGGSVHAESNGLGTGSTFVIELPLLAGVRPSRAPSPLADAVAVSATKGPALTVLIVDDNEDAREMLREALVSLSQRAAGAKDAQAALAIVDALAPDLVLVDIGLPGMDGYELARILRSRRGSGVRLVALTGYGQKADRARAHEAGFDEHLVKPIDLATLQRLLEARR